MLTHTAPSANPKTRYQEEDKIIEHPYGIELPAMTPAGVVAFAAPKIAAAAVEAWQGRQVSGVAYGLGHAVVGRNRLVSLEIQHVHPGPVKSKRFPAQ